MKHRWTTDEHRWIQFCISNRIAAAASKTLSSENAANSGAESHRIPNAVASVAHPQTSRSVWSAARFTAAFEPSSAHCASNAPVLSVFICVHLWLKMVFTPSRLRAFVVQPALNIF
jgi:hypothetical protein